MENALAYNPPFGRNSSQQNHVALNTEFQRSAFPGAKLQFFNFFSIFSVIRAHQSGERTPQAVF